ncbi:L-idonate 5-dehydrogenase [Actinobaculum sp. 352]|uniref:L-idonate 5-dehydrogenase n=1 Tax=Actinobaculum sp. 352 TaxID=2490946 RepID=UPI000F7D76A9|nr:L-idonate 5-dehydrogenase [Actinobaculum sp. 352]RTE49870.1 L-idonate 5-dehydrogenase [Actinobaculum sp. 352]
MRAVYIHGKEDLHIEEVPLPEPGEGQVRLRVAYVGVCGSDLHYYFDGAVGAYAITEPLTPGHELSATVDLDPSGKLEPGTPVTVHPATFGTPVPGAEDRPSVFPGGSYLGSASTHPHTQGGMAEYLVVRSDMVRVLPTGMDLRVAALSEPLGVGLHGINIAGDLEGKKVLVSGSGPIGLLTAAGALSKGAAEVVAADVLDGPLSRASQLGVTRTLRSDRDGLPTNYFDVILECTGVPAAVSNAFEAVRPAGLHVQVGMLAGGPQPLTIAPVISKEIEIRGSFRFNNEIDDAVQLLANRPEIADAVITHTVSADDPVAAFVTAKNSDLSGKVLVEMWL